jgi:hypothetical protein
MRTVEQLCLMVLVQQLKHRLEHLLVSKILLEQQLANSMRLERVLFQQLNHHLVSMRMMELCFDSCILR